MPGMRRKLRLIFWSFRSRSKLCDRFIIDIKSFDFLIVFLASAVPFVVTFTSDSWEAEDEHTATTDNKGFNINYEQS